MGVTIHFEGQLTDEAAFDSLVETASKYAQSLKWDVETINEAETTLYRVVDESDVNYVGPTKGLLIHPDPNSEPLRLEFDKDLVIQEYVKTQFAPIAIHKQVVGLLQELQAYFRELEVIDEGEYFESGDDSVLAHHFERFFEVHRQYLEESDKYQGPVRTEGGRILDLVER